MDYRKTHFINDKGEKLIVETEDLNISQQNEDREYDGCHVDIGWYLNNGYMTLENMRKSIEGPYYEHKKCGIPVKVEDITGKLDDYVTLEDFMKRTAYIDEGIISQEEIYQNEWLTIDEAKDETIESIRQIYESDD